MFRSITCGGRIPSKRLPQAAAGLTLLGLILGAPASGAEASTTPQFPSAVARPAGLDARDEQILDTVVSLQRAGLAEDVISKTLQKRLGLQIPTAVSAGTLRPAATTKTTSPVSPSFSIGRPMIYYDRKNYRYVVVASYSFNRLSDLDDEASDPSCWGADACSLGGEDAFGIALSRKVKGFNAVGMATWGNTGYYPVSWTRMHNAGVGDPWAGVVFKGQDVYTPLSVNPFPPSVLRRPDFNLMHGVLYYSIGDTQIGCGPLQASSKYGHSWANTALTGVSVGWPSIGIQWSTTANQWTSAPENAQSNTVQVC